MFGTGLGFLAFALSFFTPVWPIAPGTQIGFGIVSAILTVLCFAGAARAHYRPSREVAASPIVVLEGYFSHDPEDTKAQGFLVRVLDAPARDVKLHPVGMKGTQVRFDTISVLEPGQPPVSVTCRLDGTARSIWDVVAIFQIAKLEPIRVSQTVSGRQVVTSVPTKWGEARAIPLRLEFRDTHDKLHVDAGYSLVSVDPVDGAPIHARLIVQRTSLDHHAAG